MNSGTTRSWAAASPNTGTAALAGWIVAPLREICTPSRETVDPRQHPDELFEYYSIPAFQTTAEPSLTLGREIRSQKLVVNDGTVLFGKLNPRVPKVWRVRVRTGHRQIASTEFLALVPCEGVDSEFLEYLCWSSQVMEPAKSLVGGSTPSRQRVDSSAFYEISVARPQLPEQRAIAGVLRTIQSAIEIQDHVVDKVKELKSATMAKLFREGLRGEPLKQTEIGEMPKSWEVKECDAVCERISVGIVVTPAKYYVSYGVPCFRSFNVREDRLVADDLVFISPASNRLHGKSQLRAGDVLIVRTGYPGTACVVPERFDGANCIDLVFARPRRELVLSDYMARFINSAAGRRQVLSAQGGLAQQHFNVAALKRMRIAVPSHEEQVRLTRIGSRLDDNMLTAEARLAALRGLFSSMLHLLMTGQVGVTGVMSRPEL